MTTLEQLQAQQIEKLKELRTHFSYEPIAKVENKYKEWLNKKYTIESEISSLDEQIEKEKGKPDMKWFTANDVDLAYCAGIWNTGGIDVLGKELSRLKHLRIRPMNIFCRNQDEIEIVQEQE